MRVKRTSVLSNGLIWFGAAVSMAEIMTGTYFAPLGFTKGMLANITGHLIGCMMLFLAGMIGARTRRSSMETVKMSFGQKGSILFAVLNILQLVGWTAIMIYDASLAANGIMDAGPWVWCVVVGALIVVWILIGVTNLGKLNIVAMTALFLLTLVLCKEIFAGNATGYLSEDTLSFGLAVELAVAMPLSWLPLISDYTREAERPLAATAVSTAVYGLTSCWMYAIGMGMALYTGAFGIGQIMVKAGLGIAGLLIIVFSTVTTTFMDAFSAGVSTESITGKLKAKWVGVIVTVIGIIGAVIYPMDNIMDFLYLIGSVFAPMIAIMITDYFLLKKDSTASSVNTVNLAIWIAGFIIYRMLMQVDTILGNTLPNMLITVVICLIVNKILKRRLV